MTAPISYADFRLQKTQVDTRSQGCQSSLFTVVKRRRADTFDDPKPSWKPRKEAYLKAMATKPASAKLVACADKLHNLGHTLRDIEIEGVGPWRARMSESPNGAAEKQVWYYVGCLKALSNSWVHPIRDEFGRSVVRLCNLVGTSEDIAYANSLVGR